MDIWTIGHSTRTIDDLIRLLQAHAIQLVADVRRYPASRRYPHFNQAPLAEALAKNQIDYVHFPELGGRRSPRKNSPNTAWRVEAFRGYADYMMTQQFAQGIERLLELPAQKRTTLLCAEAVWWRCHRALIADYLKAGGHTVSHILGLDKTESHPFTSAAHVVNGKLSYEARNESPELDLSSSGKSSP